MSTSMINGSPLKAMLRFAMPLLFGNLLQQTYNIIDAAIVGQVLGADALASVGASSSVQFLVLGFCMGITAGFGIPVAKFFGSGNYQKMKNYVYNGAVLTAGTAAIVTTACALLCHWILNILSVQPDIYKNAYAYLLVIFLGLPFTLMYNYLSSILRSEVIFGVIIGGGLFGVLGMFIGVPAVALISNIVTDLVDKRNAAKSPADTADLHTADE